MPRLVGAALAARFARSTVKRIGHPQFAGENPIYKCFISKRLSLIKISGPAWPLPLPLATTPCVATYLERNASLALFGGVRCQRCRPEGTVRLERPLSGLFGLLCFLAGPLVFSPIRHPQAVVSEADACLNLNIATRSQLERLPGIGPVLAKRILAFRFRHGRFKRVEDLLNIQGIGPRTFEKLRPLVCVKSAAEPSTPQSGERRTR